MLDSITIRTLKGTGAGGQVFFLWRLTAAVIVVVLYGDLQAQAAPGAEEVLARLRAVDTIYSSGFTCEGAVTMEANPLAPNVGPTPMTFTLTSSAEGFALVQRASELPEMKFVPKRTDETGISPKPRFTDYDEDGRTTVLVAVGRTIYFGGDMSGMREDHVVFKVGPSGVEETPRNPHMVDIDAADAIDYELLGRGTLYAAGRGYSDHIDQITHVEENKDGMLVITAVGTFLEPGTWRLTIDPGAAYMVREAEFTTKRLGSLSLAVSTSGTVWDGAYCVPEKANCSGRVINGDFEFTSVEGKADEAILQMAEESMKEPFPLNTSIKDHRSDPPLYRDTYVHVTPRGEMREEMNKVVNELVEELDSTSTEPEADMPTAEVLADEAQTEEPRDVADENAAEESKAGPIALLSILAIAGVVFTIITRRRARKHA